MAISYLWLQQTERFVGLETDGRKHVKVRLQTLNSSLTPWVSGSWISSSTTPTIPFGVQWPSAGPTSNALGTTEILVGSLDEVLDFNITENVLPRPANYLVQVNATKDLAVPISGLQSVMSPKNGIILVAQKFGVAVSGNLPAWIPCVSGDMVSSVDITFDCWGI